MNEELLPLHRIFQIRREECKISLRFLVRSLSMLDHKYQQAPALQLFKLLAL